jgi:predicted MFS family arabinose efflux permease
VAALALTAFFTAFNALEAMLPSLITKFAPADAKGAATGVYSSSQFLGIFAGGAGGGWMLAAGGATGVFAFAIALTLIWLAIALTMRRPAPRQSRTVAGDSRDDGEIAADRRRARKRM